jgi:hypothetical protein
MTIEGISPEWMNVIYVLLGIALVCILWMAASFVFRLTMRILMVGCVGILLLGLVCSAAAYFGGGS